MERASESKQANAADWMEDAIDCLEQYRRYSEEMRAIGRGFHPDGKLGHTIEGVICGCKGALRDMRKTPAPDLLKAAEAIESRGVAHRIGCDPAGTSVCVCGASNDLQRFRAAIARAKGEVCPECEQFERHGSHSPGCLRTSVARAKPVKS